MPLLLPKTRGLRHEANYSGQPSAAWGTSVPTHATTPHTLPATYSELIASTSFDANRIRIIFSNNSASNTNSDSLVNIYVGAGSAEQLLIPNLLAGWVAQVQATVLGWRIYDFPLYVPAGSRLSARHQSVRTTTGLRVLVDLWGGDTGGWVGTKVECVGADTGNSRGTSVTPGTTSDGTLTSIGTNTFEWGFVQPMVAGNVTDTSMAQGLMTCYLGSGAATAIPGLDGFAFLAHTAEQSWNADFGRYCTVPASTTLYLSSRCLSTAEANDWAIYGVY